MPAAGADSSCNGLLSGCSSGGKSTLLKELDGRRFHTVEEPGRQIVREALETGSDALPWVNPEAFVRRAIEIAAESLRSVQDTDGPVFFDRSAVDALAHFERLSIDEIKAKTAELRKTMP